MTSLMLQDTALLRDADGRRLTAQIIADSKIYKDISVGFLYPQDEKLQEEHSRLFGNDPLCSPDLTCYLSADEFRQAQLMSQIAGFYKAFGLEISQTMRVDNISVMFEFLSYLCVKQIYAIEKGHSEGLEITRQASDSFLNEFVKPALPKFLNLLNEHSKNKFYHGLARLIKENVLKETI